MPILIILVPLVTSPPENPGAPHPAEHGIELDVIVAGHRPETAALRGRFAHAGALVRSPSRAKGTGKVAKLGHRATIILRELEARAHLNFLQD
jgi:hypothetical protein